MLRAGVNTALTHYQPYRFMIFLYLVRRIPEWFPATHLTPTCHLLSRRIGGSFFVHGRVSTNPRAWILLLGWNEGHDRRIAVIKPSHFGTISLIVPCHSPPQPVGRYQVCWVRVRHE
jgi:hypothetical protein